MNTKKLSESQKRIVNQELFRKLILNEAKNKVSRHDYRLIVKNYDYLLWESMTTPGVLLNEGMGDWFKGAFAGLKAKLGPDDKKVAKDLETEISI